MTQQVVTAEQIEALIHEGLPAARETGLTVERVEGINAWVRQPFLANQIRPGGTISGPTMMALADASMYAVILANLDGEQMAVTQDLHIRFLRRPQQQDLLAHSKIVQKGRRSVIMETFIYSSGDVEKPVAWVTGSYAVPLR